MTLGVPFWRNSEWDPIAALAPHFRVIAMDQRNAGRSTAPVSGDDGCRSIRRTTLPLASIIWRSRRPI